jgi:hypothetical protein
MDLAVGDRAGRRGLTRREVVLGAGGVTAAAIVGGGITDFLTGRRRLHRIPSFATDPAGHVDGFRSRPRLRPPPVTISKNRAATAEDTDPGFLFLGPGPVSLTASEQYGPMIVDRNGGLVWFRPVASGLEVTNFTTARYRGEPVLVWWEGKVLESGYGSGEAVVVDRSYREVTRIRAVGGRSMDMHALLLTPDGTALFTCYPQTVAADLSSFGGPARAGVYEAIIQEVEIATGRLLFEWRSLEHIPLTHSYEPVSESYDYLHPNSIQQLPDGNLLVSARHTWALYKLERRSGRVLWTLGGKQSEYTIGPGARFEWQHDAQQTAENVLTVFDNGAAGRIVTEAQSRGLMLDLDEPNRAVTLRRAYTSPQPILAGAMGSVQVLPSGRVLVGWGTESQTTEFASDGAALSDYALPAGMYSYRGQWLPWRGVPHEPPALAAGRDPHNAKPLLFASWNGATEIAAWLVETGSRHDLLEPFGIATRRGFETVIPLPHQPQFAAVIPINRHGARLRRSPTVAL